jgi:hypothetical protein
MKMNVPVTGPNTKFRQWKNRFLDFLSLKAAYSIPQLAMRELSAYLDESDQSYLFALLRHVVGDNKRADHAVRCIIAARPDCGDVAWEILCERLDARSFVRSHALLDYIILRQRPGHTLTEYVHFMRQSFDEYNETCQMIDGSSAIHPHNLGLLMLRGISSSSQYGQAKQCAINAVDTYYLVSANEIMANILHLAQNMEEELLPSADPSSKPPTPAPPICAFMAAGRASYGGRHNTRGDRSRRGPLPNKCSGCGERPHHVLLHSLR